MTDQDQSLKIEPRWYAVRTESRRETWALQNLLVNDHEAYLPVWRQAVRRPAWIQRRGKRVRVVMDEIITGPLFQGYLFVQVRDVAEWPSIYKTHGVKGMVGAGMRPAAVRRGVVEALRLAELAGLNDMMTADQLNARIAALKDGDPVKVAMGGALEEMQAIFCEAFDDERAVVLISLCGCDSRVVVPKVRLSA